MRKDEYIASAVLKISNRKAKRETEKELAEHIDELIEEYLKSGLTYEDAEQKAIFAMGNPEIVSAEMGRLYKGTSIPARIGKFFLKVFLLIVLLIVALKIGIFLSPIDVFKGTDISAYTPSGIPIKHYYFQFTDIDEYWVYKSNSTQMNEELSKGYWEKINKSNIYKCESCNDEAFIKSTNLYNDCYICVYDVYNKRFITSNTENIWETTSNWAIMIYDKANGYYYCFHQSY